MKKIISLITIVSIAMVSLFGTYSSISALTNNNSKIDRDLLGVVEKATDTEKFAVSVWFDEVDESNVEEKTCQEVKKKIDKNIIDSDVSNINNLKNFDGKEMKQKTANIDISTNQDYLSIRRSVSSKLNQENNENCVSTIISQCGISEKSITYISKYLPNVEMSLTKNEIEILSKNSKVNSLYLVDEISYDLTSESVEKI